VQQTATHPEIDQSPIRVWFSRQRALSLYDYFTKKPFASMTFSHTKKAICVHDSRANRKRGWESWCKSSLVTVVNMACHAQPSKTQKKRIDFFAKKKSTMCAWLSRKQEKRWQELIWFFARDCCKRDMPRQTLNFSLGKFRVCFGYVFPRLYFSRIQTLQSEESYTHEANLQRVIQTQGSVAKESYKHRALLRTSHTTVQNTFSPHSLCFHEMNEFEHTSPVFV